MRSIARARFLAEAEWPEAFPQFGFPNPSRAHAPEGFLFPAPPEHLKQETEEILKFQVVKTRIPSAKKEPRRLFPWIQVVGGEENGSFAPKPLHYSRFRTETISVPWRRPREGRRDAGSGLPSQEGRPCVRLTVTPLSSVPRQALLPPVVKRSDTSLITTWSQVRILPGPTLRTRSSAVEHVPRNPKGPCGVSGLACSPGAKQIGGGEEVAFFGSVKAGAGLPAQSAPPPSDGRARDFASSPPSRVSRW